MTKHNKKYWCLFCPERFDTMQEMTNHMIDTVHKDTQGNIIAFTGDKEAMKKEFENIGK